MMGSTGGHSRGGHSQSGSGSGTGSSGRQWIPPTPEELAALLSGYEIVKMLGRGGMGAVYMGKQSSLDRAVAIKILSTDLVEAEAGFVERFQNEARATAKLEHPGIVAVHDFGETQNGLLFIVMQFVDGTDVARMIAADGRLHTDHAMAITAHVCDALGYAHERGIIHRDIKPANTMVGYDGVVKVADFGLAKARNGEGESIGLTQSGVVMGTMHYMAPEMIVLGSRDVDQRVDVYAVGVMLYHMLTGKVPHGMFELPSLQVPGLDPRYDGIISRAMREDPDQRYRSAVELRSDLDAILTQPVVHVEAPEEGAEVAQEVPALPTMARPQRPGGRRSRTRTGRTTTSRGEQRNGSKASRVPGWVWPASGAAIMLLAGMAWWIGSRSGGEEELRLSSDDSTILHQSPMVVEAAPTVSRAVAPESEEVTSDSPAPAKPIVRTEPTPDALRGSRGMEGNKAGEVREFGGIEMVWCPPGTFLMGSPEDEEGRGDDETHHEVTLTRGFWLAKTECTQGQWESVMGTDVRAQGEKDNAFGEVTGVGRDHPMVFVSWEDAKKWVVKMNERHSLPEGWEWSLPTEAQWEYACRAGGEHAGRYAGELEEVAWYWLNSGSTTNEEGLKKANRWGLHDMHGNVEEWCADRCGLDGSARAYRGGCWDGDESDCRSANRSGSSPDYRAYYLGFRPAVSFTR